MRLLSNCVMRDCCSLKNDKHKFALLSFVWSLLLSQKLMIHVKILKQSDKTHFLDLSSSYTKYECYNLLLPNCLYLLSTAYCSLSFWCLPVAVAAREGRGGYADFKDRSRYAQRPGLLHFSSLLARHGANNFSLLLGLHLVWSPPLSILMVDVDM